MNRDALRKYLISLSADRRRAQLRQCGSDRVAGDFVRMMTLKAIDEAWIEQVDYLQQLRGAISGRSFAGHDPVQEYHREAHRSFKRMQEAVKKTMMRNILLSEITLSLDGSLQVVLP